MNRKILSVLTVTALLPFASQVFAADLGTDAGATVSNQASVTFSVSGVVQTVVPSNQADFVVDRKVDVLVANSANNTVAPNQSDAVLAYTVTNKTNDTLDFLLGASDGGGDFAATGLTVFVESGTTTGYQSGEDTATYINDLDEDEQVVVYVLGDIPAGAANGETNTIWLTATAADSTGTPGTALVESGAADVAGTVENVFADVDGPAAEGNQDGAHSAPATYTVTATTVAVAKSYKVIWENYDAGTPANSSNFSPAGQLKPIPGALVEYCILVSNNGGVDATAIQVSDQLGTTPSNVTTYADWLAGSIVIGDDCNDYAGGTGEDDDTTGADETDGASGSFNAGTGVVSTQVDSVTAGNSTATMFRVILK